MIYESSSENACVTRGSITAIEWGVNHCFWINGSQAIEFLIFCWRQQKNADNYDVMMMVTMVATTENESSYAKLVT